MWFFELGALPEQAVNAEQECLDWYYGQAPNRLLYQLQAALMPPCPCSYFVALGTSSYFMESIQGDLVCFLSIPFFGNFGKVSWLSIPWRRGRGGGGGGGWGGGGGGVMFDEVSG